MKTIKSFMILTITLLIASAWADDVEVVVEPKEAVINESFFVTFKIKASGGDEPYISFTPYGASVLGKQRKVFQFPLRLLTGSSRQQKSKLSCMSSWPKELGRFI